MKQRLITLILAAACLACGVIAFFVYITQDHSAPKISVKEKKITYQEGSDYGVLLEGVTAKDNIDGDISSQIFVDKIVPTQDGKAVVYYGVIDNAGNVGTGRRKIEYSAEMTEEVPTEEQTQEVQNPVEEPALQPDGVRPAMALTTDTVTIKAGEPFDVLSIVKDAVDDKDSRDALYQNIHADGAYDTMTPGSYVINYYVSDSEGNTSDPHIFTLVVQ